MTSAQLRARHAGPAAVRAKVVATPIYPSAIAISYVLGIWIQSSLDVATLLRPLLVALGIAILVTVAAVAALRGRDRGGAVAAIAILGVIGGDDLRVAALAGIGVLGLLILVWREPRFDRQIPWARITAFLNVVGTLLVVVLAARATLTLLSLPPATPAPLTHPATNAPPAPDIVVILLDAHGREDILAAQYGEDISWFTAALRDRGFDVSDHSRSNYMTTQLTLGSMFNLAAVSDLNLPAEDDPAYLAGLRALLADNRVFGILRDAGYRIESVSPGYEGVALRSSDVFVDGGQVGELESVLLANSLLRHGLDAFAADALGDQIRARVRWNLEPDNWLPASASSASATAPTFWFVHVPSPHPPYVFDRSGAPRIDRPVVVVAGGSPLLPDPDVQAASARAYADQLSYVDGLTVAALDKVIARVPDNAVIIVMSDHGPDVHVDWNHLDTTDTRERFGAFFAARTPGFPRLFGDAPTPVNLFPTLANAYLGTALPLKPDVAFTGNPPIHGLVGVGDPDSVVH